MQYRRSSNGTSISRAGYQTRNVVSSGIEGKSLCFESQSQRNKIRLRIKAVIVVIIKLFRIESLSWLTWFLSFLKPCISVKVCLLSSFFSISFCWVKNVTSWQWQLWVWQKESQKSQWWLSEKRGRDSMQSTWRCVFAGRSRCFLFSLVVGISVLWSSFTQKRHIHFCHQRRGDQESLPLVSSFERDLSLTSLTSCFEGMSLNLLTRRLNSQSPSSNSGRLWWSPVMYRKAVYSLWTLWEKRGAFSAVIAVIEVKKEECKWESVECFLHNPKVLKRHPFLLTLDLFSSLSLQSSSLSKVSIYLDKF